MHGRRVTPALGVWTAALLALVAPPVGAQTALEPAAGDVVWDLDGSGTASPGDLGLSGSPAGELLTATFGPAVAWTLPTAFRDTDNDDAWDFNEPLLLDVDGDGNVSAGDVWWDARFGARVGAADAQVAQAARPILLQFGFNDTDGDGRLSPDEMAYATRGPTIQPGDLRLRGAEAGTRVRLGDPEVGELPTALPGASAVLPLRHDLAVLGLRGARLEDGALGLAVELVNQGAVASVATRMEVSWDGGAPDAATVPALAPGADLVLLLPWTAKADAALVAADLRPRVPDFDAGDDRFVAVVRAVAEPTTTTVTVTAAPPPPVTVTTPPAPDDSASAVLPFLGGALLGVAGGAAAGAWGPLAAEAVRRLTRPEPPGERASKPCGAGSLRVQPLPPKVKGKARRFTAVATRIGGKPAAGWGPKSAELQRCNELLKKWRDGQSDDGALAPLAQALWEAGAAQTRGGPLQLVARVEGGSVQAGVALLRCAPDGDGWKWQRVRKWQPRVKDQADFVLVDVPTAYPADSQGPLLVAAGLREALEAAAKPVGTPRFEA